MKRLIYAQLSLLVLAGAAARGAELPVRPEPFAAPLPIAGEAADNVTEPVIPKREIKFDILQEPQSFPMTAADPKLLEQRYVARFVMNIPIGLQPLTQVRDAAAMAAPGRGNLATPGRPDGSPSRKSPDAADADPPIDLDNLLREHFDLSAGGSRLYRGEQLGFYRSLFYRIPGERRPPKELVDALDQGEPDLQDVGTRGAVDQRTILHEIRAATPERAKELVQVLMRLYDYGVSYPMQEEYLRQRKEAAKELLQAQQEVKKWQSELADSDKRLEGLKAYADAGMQAQETLRSQQWTLDVDVSGIKARIDACNKVLERRKDLPISRAEQAETVKLAAEIELAGAEAKRSAVAAIIQNGMQYAELLGNQRGNKVRAANGERRIGALEEVIAKCTAARKAWEACPIENGLVTIRPIKWEPARAE